MKFVRKIDEQGYFICDDFVEEINEFTIETPIPNGMYAVSGITPKWDGEKWIEVVAKPETIVVVEPTIEEKVALNEQAIIELSMLLGGMI